MDVRDDARQPANHREDADADRRPVRRPRRLCRGAGCFKVAVEDHVYCRRCQRKANARDRSRGTARERGYATSWWKRLRAQQLEREPYCRECSKLPGRRGAWVRARQVDHIKPRPRGAPYDPDGHDHWTNRQSLCAGCHTRKTSGERDG